MTETFAVVACDSSRANRPAGEVRSRAYSHTHELLLLLLSLAGTFGFALLVSTMMWRLSAGHAVASLESTSVATELNAVSYARGERLYAATCANCHGPHARGLPHLGKDLIGSSFVRSSSDASLVSFIATGRAPDDKRNTTGIPMPPKGGNTNLQTRDLGEIVLFLRGLEQPLRVARTEVPADALADLVAAAPSVATTVTNSSPVTAVAAPTAGVAVATSAGADPEAAVRGKKVFVSCVACHGKEATGMKGLGKDLVHSPFVKARTDEQLLDFIKKGRGPADPDNTTRVGMPPKGGNPALGDKQLRDVIAYVRSLQSAATTSN